VLVIGSYGQLGRELARQAWPDGTELVGFDRDTFDVSIPGVATAALDQFAPDLVVNAAAYTAVDRAETEIDAAVAGNVRAPQYVAAACAARGTALVHVSTDYVFDGTQQRPYVETDPTAPVNVYGRTKHDGEEAIRGVWANHLILRTAWLYSAFGNNFVKTMLRLAGERPEVRVINDQFGAPTSAADLARCIIAMAPRAVAGTAAFGTYHVTNSGCTSWHGFAAEIFADLRKRTGKAVKLVGIDTSQYPTPARRPAFSRLDCGKLERNFGIVMRPWQAALADVLDEMHSGK
jgi:dTDP-4-dehydrorhamnose reductase